MPSGRYCTVCRDYRIRAITKDILDGMGCRELEAKYPPLSKSAIDRHIQHVPKSLRSLAELEKQQAADALVVAAPVLEQMRRLTARLMRILDRAEARQDDATALLAHRELRRNVELLAKLTGELDPRAAGETPGAPLTVIVQYVDKAVMAAPAPTRMLTDCTDSITDSRTNSQSQASDSTDSRAEVSR